MDITQEHPLAVPVSVCLTNNADQLTPGDKTCERKVDLLLWPEFKTPTAVAASSGPADKDASGSAEAGAPKLSYSKDESESLHPFWGVRRLTTDQLQTERDQLTQKMKQSGAKFKLPSFNCEIVTKTFNAVHIAAMGKQNLTSTRFINVPHITNVKDLDEGDELIIRHVPRTKQTVLKKRNWQAVVRDEARKSQHK